MAQNETIAASLFYDSGKQYTVGELKLHLILEEKHSVEAVVTEHPVQDGSVVSDHIALKLREGSLKGLVTNHPIQESYDRHVAGMSDRPQNYALDAWSKLKEIATKCELVTIVTVLETYKDVAVTYVGTGRDGTTGDAQEFEIKFKQVRIVRLKEDKITAQVQPSSMDSDIDRITGMEVHSGQVSTKPRSK